MERELTASEIEARAQAGQMEVQRRRQELEQEVLTLVRVALPGRNVVGVTIVEEDGSRADFGDTSVEIPDRLPYA